MKRNTILFVDFLPIGGSVVALGNHLKQMHAKRPFDRCVVIGSRDGVLESLQADYGFTLYTYSRPIRQLENIFRFPWRYFFDYIMLLAYVLKVALVERPNLIHTYHYAWGIYTTVVGFLLRVPVILYLCDVTPMQSKISRFLMKFYPDTWYIAVSKYVYRTFVEIYKLPALRTKLVYDGVDQTIFFPAKREEFALKQSNRRKNIVYASRISPDRDIEKFIETAVLVHEKYPDVHFYHWGYHPRHSDSAYFKRLNRMVKSMKAEQYTHFKKHQESQEPLRDFMQKAYLTLVPARQFALPNVAIQSMLCGTPVIAYQTGGNREIITSSAIGDLVPENAAWLFAQAILRYVEGEKDYSQVALKASQFAQKKFSLNKQFNLLMGVYEAVLAAKPAKNQ